MALPSGVHYLKFRIADLRIQHALIDPRVRCNCMHLSRDSGSRLELLPMQLEQPADGTALAPSLGNTIVHRIDSNSPLAPRRQPLIGRSSSSIATTGSNISQAQPGSLCRHCCYSCGTCGATFASIKNLQQHCRYLAQTDRLSGVPEEYCHTEMGEEDLAQSVPPQINRADLEDHLAQG